MLCPQWVIGWTPLNGIDVQNGVESPFAREASVDAW